MFGYVPLTNRSPVWSTRSSTKSTTRSPPVWPRPGWISAHRLAADLEHVLVAKVSFGSVPAASPFQ